MFAEKRGVEQCAESSRPSGAGADRLEIDQGGMIGMALPNGRAPVTPVPQYLSDLVPIADRREALEQGERRRRLARRSVELDDPDIALGNAALHFEQVGY